MTYDQALTELTRLLGVSRAELEPLLRAVVLQMPLRAADNVGEARGKTLGEVVAPGRLSAHRFRNSARFWQPSQDRIEPIEGGFIVTSDGDAPPGTPCS